MEELGEVYVNAYWNEKKRIKYHRRSDGIIEESIVICNIDLSIINDKLNKDLINFYITSDYIYNYYFLFCDVEYIYVLITIDKLTSADNSVDFRIYEVQKYTYFRFDELFNMNMKERMNLSLIEKTM